MNAKTGFGQVQLRRLSTKPAVSPTDHALSTQWVWYWLDENNSSWRRYDSELMVCLPSQLHLKSLKSDDKPITLIKDKNSYNWAKAVVCLAGMIFDFVLWN